MNQKSSVIADLFRDLHEYMLNGIPASRLCGTGMTFQIG